MHVSELIREKLGTRKNLQILETGTIRADGDTYQSNDGWSTLTFAEHVNMHGGSVWSVDLDTSVAERVLERYGVANGVRLHAGHSIEVLSNWVMGFSGPLFDVAYLDSDNDAQLILHEYFLARHLVKKGGLIMVDDVDMDSPVVLKGHAVVPWLDQHGIPYTIQTRTGDKLKTGVLTMQR
jgi:predicted O-methyltransferase YrrM